MRRRLGMWLLLLAVALDAGGAEAVSGGPVADFTLNDYRGREHSLAEFRDSKLVVLAVLGVECPLAKLYGVRLAELEAEYRSQGVAFVGLNANVHDSVSENAAYARRHEIKFPLLKDLANPDPSATVRWGDQTWEMTAAIKKKRDREGSQGD